NQGGGVLGSGNGLDLTQSTLEKTGNQTDLALNGRGFFTIAGENGAKLLTRNGQFLLNTEGKLVTADGGHAVLDSSGNPISLNAGLPVHVDENGQISQGDPTGGGAGAAVKLGVVDVSDARQLVKLGGNLMTTRNPAAVTEVGPDTKVHQGEIESSGVD